MLTRDGVILRGIKKFGDKITYIKFIYNRHDDIGIFTCREHGDFERQVNAFLLSITGCQRCGEHSGYTKEEIVEFSKNNFNDMILFEKFIHNGMSKKSIFTCKEHGDFEKTITGFIFSEHGCTKCARKASGYKNTRKRGDILEEFYKKHGDRYDYSEFEYIRTNKKGIINCHKVDEYGNEHGRFLQNYACHIKGNGCPKCCINLPWDIHRLNIIGNRVHGNNIGFSLISEIKNVHIKLPFICNKNKSHPIFYKTISKLIYSKQGCPVCKEPKGEYTIRKFLDDNNIKYEPHKRFPECRNNKPLEFDFYISEYNTCIEFDGQYHYTPDFLKEINVRYGKWHTIEKHKNVVINDNIKNEYCAKNNINILRIPFWKAPYINDILSDYLNINK